MKTLNRQNASIQPADTLLAELNCRVRKLWSTKLDAPSDVRSDLLARLCDLDLDIERLAIRSATDSLAPDDHHELDRCARRLADIERGWKPVTMAISAGWR